MTPVWVVLEEQWNNHLRTWVWEPIALKTAQEDAIALLDTLALYGRITRLKLT